MTDQFGGAKSWPSLLDLDISQGSFRLQSSPGESTQAVIGFGFSLCPLRSAFLCLLQVLIPGTFLNKRYAHHSPSGVRFPEPRLQHHSQQGNTLAAECVKDKSLCL